MTEKAADKPADKAADKPAAKAEKDELTQEELEAKEAEEAEANDAEPPEDLVRNEGGYSNLSSDAEPEDGGEEGVEAADTKDAPK